MEYNIKNNLEKQFIHNNKILIWQNNGCKTQKKKKNFMICKMKSMTKFLIYNSIDYINYQQIYML